ncbi:predicted protein [Histoplasma capsulatum var. duboisii H88]|uniref:Predicted protein n=1 Tax=Ajellomyces capsulatus (strain H88) TaxID=544711 RepID=F0UV09_AJEC8|nr:predicted protein [Histoplasma capsulatum var. duboisii H88]
MSCNFPLRAAHVNLQFASAIQFRLKKQTPKCAYQCSSGRRTWELTDCVGDKVLGTSYYKALDSTVQSAKRTFAQPLACLSICRRKCEVELCGIIYIQHSIDRVLSEYANHSIGIADFHFCNKVSFADRPDF